MFRVSYPAIEFHPAKDESNIFHEITITMVVKEPETGISTFSTKRGLKTSMFNVYPELKVNTKELLGASRRGDFFIIRWKGNNSPKSSLNACCIFA
jgi:hypothetical protein